jgi:hypothetical protein
MIPAMYFDFDTYYCPHSTSELPRGWGLLLLKTLNPNRLVFSFGKTMKLTCRMKWSCSALSIRSVYVKLHQESLKLLPFYCCIVSTCPNDCWGSY